MLRLKELHALTMRKIAGGSRPTLDDYDHNFSDFGQSRVGRKKLKQGKQGIRIVKIRKKRK
jgi:hypothetical protein